MKKTFGVPCTLVLLFFCSAGAPSVAEEGWSNWNGMRAGSFQATPQAAVSQFLSMGATSPQANRLRDALTRYLATGNNETCRATVSRPGDRFSKVGMNRPDMPSIATNQVQHFGRSTPVVRCDIDGIALYWFNEPGRGCNNLAILEETSPAGYDTQCISTNQADVYGGISLPGYHCGTCYVGGVNTRDYVERGSSTSCTVTPAS